MTSPSATERIRFLVGLFLALGLSALASCPAAALGATECSGRKEAYSSDRKVKPAKRKAGIAEAEREAFGDFAARAWSRGALTETTTSVRTATTVDVWHVERLRSYSRTNELLRRGEYVRSGDKRSLFVRYCVPAEVFDQAVERLAAERDEETRLFRARLASVERAMVYSELRWAAREIVQLGVAVQAAYLDHAYYRSPVSGEMATFLEWLSRWSDELKREGFFVEDLFYEARLLADGAHLARSELVLDRIEQIQPSYLPSRGLRRSIEGRRDERRGELERSARLAEVGRFSAAESRIERARRIDQDDAASLETAVWYLEQSRGVFRSFNPRWSLGMFLAAGTLGADVGAASAHLSEHYYGFSPASTVMGLGLDGRVQLSRSFVWLTTVGFGKPASFQSDSPEGAEFPLAYGQLTTGIGYRSVRSSRRLVSFGISGGLAGETVSISEVDLPGLDMSDARVGGFLRLEAEWRWGSIFVQRGVGFERKEADPTNFHRWADQVQFGLRFFMGGRG